MPAAWVTEEQRAKRILLAIICPVDYKTTVAWNKRYSEVLAALPARSVPAWIPGLPFDAARNMGVAEAIKGGFGYLAFLDADTLPDRPDAFSILQSTNLPLVAGIYRKRFPPFQYAAYNMVQKDGKLETAQVPEPPPWGQVSPVDCVPTGLMLIRQDLLITAFQKWKKPFDWTMNPLHPEEWGTSEDYNFTLKCKLELGVQPYVHWGVTAEHEVSGRISAQTGGMDFGLFKPDSLGATQRPG